ncbi:MAG: glycosyltransferase [Chloroflexi bacterium]|nr:glycosyltransferase [Chloroflexota bacterium]
MLGGKNTGGMNVYVRELSRELGRRGYAVDVFTRCESQIHPPIVELGPNARVVHICAGPLQHQEKNRLYEYLPEFVREVAEFADMEGCRYDVIHSHYWLSGWVARELQARWRVPVVQMFHTLGAMKDKVARPDESREHPQRIDTEREIMRWADRVVAATELDKRQMVTLYNVPGDPIRIVPCGVDLALFRPTDQAHARQEVGLDAGSSTVLFVGRMEPLKGIDDLLHAIALIQRNGNMPCSRLSLMLIGGSAEDHPDAMTGEMGRLIQMRDALGLQEMVAFLGAQGQDILPLYYAAADVVVMPSHYESFGMVALEAMACGTPVIASDVGGLSYTVVDGVTGFLVPAKDPDSLADAICHVLNDQVFRDTLGQQAARAARSYGWERIADQILAVYDEAESAYRVRDAVSATSTERWHQAQPA